MVAIKIPNTDPEDKSAWEEFVLPVKMVHSDHYGSKTLWAKIPADGSTTLSRSIKPSSSRNSLRLSKKMFTMQSHLRLVSKAESLSEGLILGQLRSIWTNNKEKGEKGTIIFFDGA